MFDSNQTAGEGTYNTNLSFSGTYNNNPADVTLILNVEAPTEYKIYLPAAYGDGGAAAPQANISPFLLPFFGIVALGTGWLTNKKR